MLASAGPMFTSETRESARNAVSLLDLRVICTTLKQEMSVDAGAFIIWNGCAGLAIKQSMYR